jgi:hypothetical protein
VHGIGDVEAAEEVRRKRRERYVEAAEEVRRKRRERYARR